MTKIQKFVLAITLAIIAVAWLREYCGGQATEIAQLKEQLAKANTNVPLKHDTVYLHKTDTVHDVVTSPVIMAELKALRRQRSLDEQTIKDLGLRLKQLDAMQTTVTETKDSARAAYDHNFRFFSYSDRWSHLQFRLNDSTFYYNIRDSLLFTVYHEYRHRFLWWRWGIKGYYVKALNFNPHTTIIYNQYVKPEK